MKTAGVIDDTLPLFFVFRKPPDSLGVEKRLTDKSLPTESNYNEIAVCQLQRVIERDKQMEETHTLSHTTWNCKYHIVFAPKYRRKIFYGEKRLEIGAILRQLCKWKGVNILEAEVCPDHVHMLLEIPPKYSVSQFMGYLKGKSSLMIYEKWGNMKYKYRNREFWCRGYYVDTVGKNTKKIQEYIAHQLEEDKAADQLTLDLGDPFNGKK